jgi:hypothetical protein
MNPTREEVVRSVQDYWGDGQDQLAASALADLEVNDLSVDEKIVQRDIRLYREGTKTIVPDQRMVLAHYISIHNRCESMVTTVERDKVPSRFIRLIGHESDVETDRLLYRSLVSEMLSDLAGVNVAGMRRKQADETLEQFCEEFAWKTHERLDVVKRMVESSAKKKGLSARLRDRADIVKARYREMFPNLTVVPHKALKKES